MSLLAVSCQKGVPRFFPYQLLQWKLLHNRSIIGVTWQLYHHQKNSSVVKKVNKSLPKRLRRERERARLFRPKTTLIILGIVFWRAVPPPAEFEKLTRRIHLRKDAASFTVCLKKVYLEHGELERISLGSLVCPKSFS